MTEIVDELGVPSTIASVAFTDTVNHVFARNAEYKFLLFQEIR